MAFIRRVRIGSGATAVQIAEYAGGRQRIVTHVGSARTEAELGMLLARARALLEDPGQGVLDLGVEPAVPVVGLAAPAAEPALFEASAAGPSGRRDGPGRVVDCTCPSGTGGRSRRSPVAAAHRPPAAPAPLLRGRR